MLERMIERLPRRCAVVCRLVYLEELTHSEAARALGMSVKAVEKQVARARRRLRSLAGASGDAVSTIEDGGEGGVSRVL
jgi:RNA polymerase sigma factor (sigma-70 family)